MLKYLSLAALAALLLNTSPVFANDAVDAQEQEYAYAHEGDDAKDMGKAKMKKEVKKEMKKDGKKRNSEIKHHPHNPMKHKPHNIHNYYTDQQN